MTLVAAWKEGNTPVLIGDIVVSIQDDRGFNIPHHQLPTRDDLEKKLPKEVRIVKPRQKVYKISDTFAVGWSGARITADLVIDNLFQAYRGQNPSLDALRKYFRRIKGITTRRDRGCTIIGWVIEDETAHCFRWRSNAPDKFQIDDMFVIGSGIDYFKEASTHHFKVGKDPLEGVLGRLGYLLKEEIFYGTTLNKRFGGGYKVIYYDGDKFIVLRSVTYIFFRVEEAEKEGELGVLAPFKVIKTYQDNEIMQTMALSLDDGKSHQPSPHKMYYTVPLNIKDGDSFEVNSNLSFASQLYCVCIDIKLKDKLFIMGEEKIFISSMILSITDGRESSLLEVQKQSGDIEILTLKDELFQKVFKFLQGVKTSTMFLDDVMKRVEGTGVHLPVPLQPEEFAKAGTLTCLWRTGERAVDLMLLEIVGGVLNNRIALLFNRDQTVSVRVKDGYGQILTIKSQPLDAETLWFIAITWTSKEVSLWVQGELAGELHLPHPIQRLGPHILVGIDIDGRLGADLMRQGYYVDGHTGVNLQKDGILKGMQISTVAIFHLLPDETIREMAKDITETAALLKESSDPAQNHTFGVVRQRGPLKLGSNYTGRTLRSDSSPGRP